MQENSICTLYFLLHSASSSVSLVSDYRLDGRGSISNRGKGFFSSLCVQTSSEAHPASCPMGTGVPFPRVKHGRGVTLPTRLNLVPSSRMSRSYTSCLLWHLRGGSGTALLFVTFLCNTVLHGLSCWMCLSFTTVHAAGSWHPFELFSHNVATHWGFMWI
jgi:hypothetical protein